MQVPFLDLKVQYSHIKPEIDRVLAAVFAESRFIGGRDVSLFEEEFQTYIGSKHCIGVNSGTDALILGLRALDLPKGSEVIVPVNTFYATAVAVIENGLLPRFVAVDESDFGMSLSDLTRKITNKTKAVIAVHLFGQSDKFFQIQNAIRQTGKDIVLVEDACQAHGAMYGGKKTGTYGIFAAFSFYPGKNLGAYGDGGAIVTDTAEIAQKFKMLREYGQEKKYHHVSLGVNSRLDTIQAAVLRVKLAHLDDWNRKRETLAQAYEKDLEALFPNIQTPKRFDDRKSVYHIYCVRAKRRDALQQFLSENGIGTLIHYPVPLHMQKAFAYLGYRRGDFPLAEKLAGEILSLPMYPELTGEMRTYVVQKIKEFYD